MKNTKKVVLFIVEGVSDKEYLTPISKIIEEEGYVMLRFQVTRGDILTDFDTNPRNVVDRLKNVVFDYLHFSKLKFSDLFEIVQITDMDGIYLSDDFVFEDSTLASGETIYDSFGIFNRKKENITSRNKRKRENLSVLLGLSELKHRVSVKYRLYFFSCNIDHYFCGNPNFSVRDKIDASREIINLYWDHPYKYKEFIENNFVIGSSYLESWQMIKDDKNSISRRTNFHLFFKER